MIIKILYHNVKRQGDGFMYSMLLTVGIIICVLALILTAFIGKEVGNKIETYKAIGNSPHDELARSREYETSSFRNVRSLTWIYTLLFIVILIVCLIFLF